MEDIQPPACTTLAKLISAHDAALEHAAHLQAMASRHSATTPDRDRLHRKHDRTTSGNLLRRAAAALGIDRISAALHLTPAALQEFMASGRTMTLSQQRTFALALLTLVEGHPDLRRRAMGLLGQVRAAEEFEAGVTERHLNAPPRPHEWR